MRRSVRCSSFCWYLDVLTLGVGELVVSVNQTLQEDKLPGCSGPWKAAMSLCADWEGTHFGNVRAPSEPSKLDDSGFQGVMSSHLPV
jgi:hypothetical protein